MNHSNYSIFQVNDVAFKAELRPDVEKTRSGKLKRASGVKAFIWGAEDTIKANREVLDAALVGLGIAPTKSNFSQKAGCSCGCSPGFNLHPTEVSGPADLFISKFEPKSFGLAALAPLPE